MKFNQILLMSSLLLGSVHSAYACSACGCTTSPGWENQGFVSQSGWMVDLKQDYIDQNKLRSSTHTVSNADKVLPNAREIEDYTTQYYTTLSVDYKNESPWGLTLSIPYVDRTHATVVDGDTDTTHSHTKSLGDIRLIGRYQIDGMGSGWGVRFGMQVPTGSYTQRFDTGPQAGELIDRGLQPGTGTREMILGLYRFATLNDSFDYFAQTGYKKAITQRDSYKPGAVLTGDMGIRWIGSKGVVPQLNLNAKHESKDMGESADTANSGGDSVYLSPGVTVDVVGNLKAYGFIQIPVYLDVNGYQLVPQWTSTLGLTYRF
jgi:hypothetical protein